MGISALEAASAASNTMWRAAKTFTYQYQQELHSSSQDQQSTDQTVYNIIPLRQVQHSVRKKTKQNQQDIYCVKIRNPLTKPDIGTISLSKKKKKNNADN